MFSAYPIKSPIKIFQWIKNVYSLIEIQDENNCNYHISIFFALHNSNLQLYNANIKLQTIIVFSTIANTYCCQKWDIEEAHFPGQSFHQTVLSTYVNTA